MNWLLAYLLLFIIIILLCWVTFKEGATWKSRIVGWGLLLLPVALFMWDYPVVYYQHVRDCKADGGLKVLIKPEKVEQVQFNGEYYGESTAHSNLHKFYPYIKLVEAVGNITERAINAKAYFLYSVLCFLL